MEQSAKLLLTSKTLLYTNDTNMSIGFAKYEFANFEGTWAKILIKIFFYEA
jgi:hypothetical protein